MSELNVTPLTITETEKVTTTGTDEDAGIIKTEVLKTLTEPIGSESLLDDPGAQSKDRIALSEVDDHPRGPKMSQPRQGKPSGSERSVMPTNDSYVARGLSQIESPLLPKLRAYSHEHTISLVMKSLCEQVPEAFPNYRTWEGPDIIPLIYKRIQTKGYIETLWPSIRMVLGENRFNINWTARVIIAMTVWIIVWEIAPGLKCNERSVDSLKDQARRDRAKEAKK